MAILKEILGDLSGCIGPVVACKSGNKLIIRSRPGRRTRPYSAAELDNHAKFRAEQHFLQPLRPFVNIGYRYHPGFATPI